MWGCKGPTAQFPFDIPTDDLDADGWPVWKWIWDCPNRLLRDLDELDRVFTLYRAYKDRGHAPFDGGSADQPPKLMKAFDLIAAEMVRMDPNREPEEGEPERRPPKRPKR